MSTIYDVAKRAGVSKTTVSKILSGKENVRQSTLDKVNKAMEELNYIPSHFAQGMRVAHTKSIAVLLPEQYNYGLSEILRGIEETSAMHGYTMIVCSTGIDANMQMQYLREMISRQVDGIIFFSYARIDKNIEYLIELNKKTPVIVMDALLHENEALSSVRIDGEKLTQKAVQYLIDKGRTRIAYIKALGKYTAGFERYLGYCAALEENHIAYDPKLVKEADFKNHLTAGYEVTHELIEMKDPPDAIMTMTDMFAIGALNCLLEAGIRVPEEINVMGFDNIPLCSWIRPKLSTASQNQHHVGRTAFQLMLELIQDPQIGFRRMLLQGELVIRDTT